MDLCVCCKGNHSSWVVSLRRLNSRRSCGEVPRDGRAERFRGMKIIHVLF